MRTPRNTWLNDRLISSGVVEHLVERGRPLVAGAAPGREDVADELVVGPILGELPAQPARHGHGALRRDRVAIDAQQVGPAHRPVVGILRPLEQLVDQPGPLVGSRVGQERAGLRRGRQRADGVEEDAAQEGGVVGQVAGRDAQPGELVPDVAVDEVRFRRPGEA